MSIKRIPSYSFFVRLKTVRIVLFAILCFNFVVPQQQAYAEVCPIYDFQSLFFEEYSNQKWDNRSGNLEITWSQNGTVIFGENIVRSFTQKEQTWVREGFTSWDDALSTVSFKEVANASSAQISIGLVPLNVPNSSAHWNASARSNLRFIATIRIKESLITLNELSIKSKTPFLDSDSFQRNWLIGIVQHELGNVLGLGDIKPNSGIVSIQNDPFSPNSVVIPLRESDVGMMRQHYGESTCPSTFNGAYKAAAELKAKQEAEAKAAAELKAKQEAEAKAAAELKAKQEAEEKAAAELKAKQEAEEKAAAELKAKQEAEEKAATELKAKQEAEAAAAQAAELKAKQEAAAKAAALKKTTIVCVKGKLTKKVTAVKPKCPAGYKVKK